MADSIKNRIRNVTKTGGACVGCLSVVLNATARQKIQPNRLLMKSGHSFGLKDV